MAKTPSKSGPTGPRIQHGGGVLAVNDIYTVMVSIALASVLGALAFAIYRCQELLGKPFPGF